MFNLDKTLARDCLAVGQLPLCQILLMNDSQYPWLILVPRQQGLREICELDEAQLAQFWQESNIVSQVLQEHFHAEKLNIAALGNMVPQLHIHHIARFAADPAWPKPVWGALPATPYSESQLAQRLELLRGALLAMDSSFQAASG